MGIGTPKIMLHNKYADKDSRGKGHYNAIGNPKQTRPHPTRHKPPGADNNQIVEKEIYRFSGRIPMTRLECGNP